MSESLFRIEQRMERKEISEYLRDLAGSFENGEIKFSAGSQSVVLDAPERPELEIDVEEDGGGEISLEIEIEWYRNGSENLEIE